MKHQSSIHQIDIVKKDEEARGLKLRVLLLRDENVLLSDKIVQKDVQLASLKRETKDVATELQETKRKSKQQDVRLQKQAKELADVKVGEKICDQVTTLLTLVSGRT